MISSFLAATLLAFAADKAPVFTDPSKAGVDYALQGEYVGTLKDSDGGQVKIGVQVVAEGKGSFAFRAYPGGLPGAGFDGSEQHSGKAKLVEGTQKATLEFPETEATIEADKIEITKGKYTGTLEKVRRESPTLGAKAPEGAVVLFDGTSASEWNNGKLTEGNLLDVGVTSKKKFKDFTAHLEFRTPFMPESRGQGRGNSGVFPQNRYEIQVLDSFGLTGEDNECGGIYKLAKPAVNMALPPLTWQTYDIEFTAAKFDAEGKKTADAVLTLRHNGVLIHDKLNLKLTPGGDPKETATAGPFQLQNHNDKVAYRNIWVVETK
jgi:hypothetical protein